MSLSLTPHPSTPCEPLRSIEAAAERGPGGLLRLCYVATGRIGTLALPTPAESVRTDELWRRTCFEAFVRPAGGEGYIELNFSPSTQWAAYGFSGYRDGMTAAAVPAPRLAFRADADRCELSAEVDLSSLATGPWRVGLSAVIEGTDGTIAYWALAHPPGRPDFHHRDCFALDLPEAGRP